VGRQLNASTGFIVESVDWGYIKKVGGEVPGKVAGRDNPQCSSRPPEIMV
jgi:hypothetical protein